MDRDGVKLLLTPAVSKALPRLRPMWLDAGYNGKDTGQDGIERGFGWSVDLVKPPLRYKQVWVPADMPADQIDWSTSLPPPGFRVLARRWVVERTFAWQRHQRRLRKDDELRCTTSEALLDVAIIRLMVRRLGPHHRAPPPVPYERAPAICLRIGPGLDDPGAVCAQSQHRHA